MCATNFKYANAILARVEIFSKQMKLTKHNFCLGDQLDVEALARDDHRPDSAFRIPRQPYKRRQRIRLPHARAEHRLLHEMARLQGGRIRPLRLVWECREFE